MCKYLVFYILLNRIAHKSDLYIVHNSVTLIVIIVRLYSLLNWNDYSLAPIMPHANNPHTVRNFCTTVIMLDLDMIPKNEYLPKNKNHAACYHATC